MIYVCWFCGTTQQLHYEQGREGGRDRGRGGKKRNKRERGRERDGAREASFHRETKIAVINGPELWTRGAFF